MSPLLTEIPDFAGEGGQSVAQKLQMLVTAYAQGAQVQTPVVATAASATAIVMVVPISGTVKAVNWYPDASITGQDTNTRKVSIVDEGNDGAGTTEIAEEQFDNTIDAVQYVKEPLTLSTVTGALNVVAGDVLTFVSAAVGTGLADPGGVVEVVIEPTAYDPA